MAAAKKPNIVFALWKIPVGGARIAIALAAAVVLTGCASASVATIPPVTAEVACETPVPERNLLLGVALSGGRSRAALFGTAGLEALAGVRTADGASLIEKISHLSSVSGGSLAASYHVLKKPGRDVKVLAPGDTLSTPYRAFFATARSRSRSGSGA